MCHIYVYLLVHWAMQCSFNVIAYKDKPRLRTALEMLNTTQEIERRLEEVCGAHVWFAPVMAI
jgi:acylglycerol lipase